MKNKWKDILSIIQTLIMIVILVEVSILLLNSDQLNTRRKGSKRVAQKNPRKVNVNLSKLIKNSRFIGNKNAKVTLVKFNSFSCGFCRRAKNTIFELSKKYPNRLKIVYKHFNRTPSDIISSQAVECAGEQGKFWKMYSAIFDKHGNVNNAAKTIKLNLTKFQSCLKSKKYKLKTTHDTNDARHLQIRGTPAFLINDTLLYGYKPSLLNRLVTEAIKK